jgi:hypothetical protein
MLYAMQQGWLEEAKECYEKIIDLPQSETFYRRSYEYAIRSKDPDMITWIKSIPIIYPTKESLLALILQGNVEAVKEDFLRMIPDIEYLETACTVRCIPLIYFFFRSCYIDQDNDIIETTLISLQCYELIKHVLREGKPIQIKSMIDQLLLSRIDKHILIELLAAITTPITIKAQSVITFEQLEILRVNKHITVSIAMDELLRGHRFTMCEYLVRLPKQENIQIDTLGLHMFVALFDSKMIWDEVYEISRLEVFQKTLTFLFTYYSDIAKPHKLCKTIIKSQDVYEEEMVWLLSQWPVEGHLDSQDLLKACRYECYETIFQTFTLNKEYDDQNKIWFYLCNFEDENKPVIVERFLELAIRKKWIYRKIPYACLKELDVNTLRILLRHPKLSLPDLHTEEACNSMIHCATENVGVFNELLKLGASFDVQEFCEKANQMLCMDAYFDLSHRWLRQMLSYVDLHDLSHLRRHKEQFDCVEEEIRKALVNETQIIEDVIEHVILDYCDFTPQDYKNIMVYSKQRRREAHMYDREPRIHNHRGNRFHRVYMPESDDDDQ